MWETCSNVKHMKMIQIRHVPDEVHRTLKVRAAQAGMSLSDYLLRELERLAARPTRADILERMRARGSSGITSEEIVKIIREGRER